MKISVKNNYAIKAILAILILNSYVSSQVTFRLGALSLEDKRFIYPAIDQYHVPDGQSLAQHNGAITVEPRLDFIRNHEENCYHPTRGRFSNHDEIYWYCSNVDKTKPGQIKVATPDHPGHRTLINFKGLPNKDDFLTIIPLATRKTVVVVAKTITPGAYKIYTINDGLLDKELATFDPLFADATKLRVIIAPDSAKKPDDLYFYMENVAGATNIYHYKISDKSTTKIELIKIGGTGPLSEVKRIMHATVSEHYISFTGVMGVKTDQLSFIFFQADPSAVSQIQNKVGFLSFREVPQENGKTETATSSLAWAYKYEADSADILVFNKTPKDTTTKPYVQFGRAVKTVTTADSVNDFLKTHVFDREFDEHKKYEIHHVHLNTRIIRFSWIDPVSKDIKSVWETKWGTTNKHSIALTQAKLSDGIKDLIFVFPSYIVAIKQHFEYNYNHFNYIFNPKSLPESKRSPGTDHNFEIDVTNSHNDGSSFELKKMNIVYHITDTKQLRTYGQEDKNKASISAIVGTLVEFQIPEINFRGNNIHYSADMKGNGIMIFKNTFNVKPEIATDKIQILDDLYGQSIAGNTYSIHDCDMLITNEINVDCKKAAKDVKYQFGELKQIAQANNLHGIYTAFESKNNANPAEIPITKFIKKTHEKGESLEIVLMNFMQDLGGKPDMVSMGISKNSVTVYAARDGKISRRDITDLDGKSKESFDITELIPSFKGKSCKPKEISKTDFYDINDNLVVRAHIVYQCDGGLQALIDWRTQLEGGHPNVREILNYNSADTKVCVTKGGILELDTKTGNLFLITANIGEIINYNLADYSFTKWEELICDHPGEGHAIIRGKMSDNKNHYLMINLGVRDPLSLVFTRFESPVENAGEITSSRYMNYFLLTFTEKSSGVKKYLLLNPGNKEIRVKAQAQAFEIVFSATGHEKSSKKKFELVMNVVGHALKTTTVDQFPGQFSDFNKLGRYDLDRLLRFSGPVSHVDVIIPPALKDKVEYNNQGADKSRISNVAGSPANPDITIVIPSAQIMRLIHADGIDLMFRSNEFETEVKEIYQGVNQQFIYYIQEPCDDMSFKSKSGKGTIVLSCSKSSDVLIHVVKVGTGRVENRNVRFMGPSISSSITHISEGVAVIARTVKSSDSEVTVKVDKLDVSKVVTSHKRKYAISDASATIASSKPIFHFL